MGGNGFKRILHPLIIAYVGYISKIRLKEWHIGYSAYVPSPALNALEIMHYEGHIAFGYGVVIPEMAGEPVLTCLAKLPALRTRVTSCRRRQVGLEEEELVCVNQG
jgi:hypothetical protein